MSETYVSKLKSYAKHSESFRRVLFTGKHSQLVVMSLRPGEEIGTEVHEVDQIFYIVDGEGTIVLDGRPEKLEKGMVVCVPVGVVHNLISATEEPMKLFTVYSPPQHAPGTLHETRAESEAHQPEFPAYSNQR